MSVDPKAQIEHGTRGRRERFESWDGDGEPSARFEIYRVLDESISMLDEGSYRIPEDGSSSKTPTALVSLAMVLDEDGGRIPLPASNIRFRLVLANGLADKLKSSLILLQK